MVNESGDAIWIMEKSIPLTKSDLNEWENARKDEPEHVQISKYIGI